MEFPDIDEQEATDTDTERTPVQLAREAEEPATVAYVRTELRKAVSKHVTQCDGRRSVRKWRIWLAAAVGAVLVIQFGWLIAGRAIIRETVRDVVREELAGRIIRATAEGIATPDIIAKHVDSKSAP